MGLLDSLSWVGLGEVCGTGYWYTGTGNVIGHAGYLTGDLYMRDCAMMTSGTFCGTDWGVDAMMMLRAANNENGCSLTD